MDHLHSERRCNHILGSGRRVYRAAVWIPCFTASMRNNSCNTEGNAPSKSHAGPVDVWSIQSETRLRIRNWSYIVRIKANLGMVDFETVLGREND